MSFVDDSIKLLGLGSLFFGAWGLVHPKSIGELTGDGTQASRQLGMRDTVIGLGLFTPVSPVAVAARCASDAHDAIRLREKSPAIALIAAVTVVWDAAVLVELLRARRSAVS
jgi:branched-subunit amino acid permease